MKTMAEPHKPEEERAYCKSILWGRSCRWGDKCCYGHDVPEHLLAAQRAHVSAGQRSRSKLLSAAERARKERPPCPMPPWLEEMREERVVRYDTVRYPLAEAAAAVLELRPGETLDMLHLREAPTEDTPVPSCPTLVHAFAHAGHKLPRAWKQAKASAKAVQRLHRTPAYQAFLRLYDRFVTEVLLPSCAGYDMVYQRPPTLRVAMPARTATIDLHCDSDYDGHSSAECNFWVPLTRVSASNSLHVESAPGLGDLQLGPGLGLGLGLGL